MLPKIFTTVFCLILSPNFGSCFYNNQNSIDEVIFCAIEVANNNFEYRVMTVILSRNVDDNNLTAFFKGFKGTKAIDIKTNDLIKQVVIIVNDYQSFTTLLSRSNPELIERNIFHGRVKLIVVLTSSSNKLSHITSVLWGYYVTNVVIITKDNGNAALYTYFPYKNHLNCRNKKPVLIGHWKDYRERGLSTKLYPDKMKNMHECPVYISTNKIYHQASERKIPLQIMKRAIVRLLRDIMNFTPIISVRDYINIDSEAKNWSESLNDVISGYANISTCTIPLGVDTLGMLDYSLPYFRIRLAWIAPPISTGPGLWRLLSPLNSYLWLILLIVIFLVLSFPFFTKLKRVKNFCNKYFRNFNKMQSTSFRVWGAMLGQTIRVTPKRFRDFYIVGLWLWFTFVVRNAYQSVLIGALKTDTIVGNFANLKEPIESGYRFGGRAGIYSHFEFDSFISDGFEIVPERKFEEMFRDVLEGKRKFIIAASLEYAFAYCLAQGIRENECVHVLPDSILTLPLVVWLKRNSPFTKSLDVWLPRLIESGLLDKDANIRTNYPTSVTSDPSPLSSHQTLSIFLCLIFGFVVSAIVFLLELLRNKASKYIVVEKNRIRGLDYGHSIYFK